eukprot:TRINITY_DN1014_c0_g1_i1.p1 TRINITY_DN1014_c0_g1~~TRINITY_DN1014_c0_g1_i1.p1  ORF type:complete len:209 (+),score=33.61 TRINITY_DN1014_c0_g1_i1:66-692(+)
MEQQHNSPLLLQQQTRTKQTLPAAATGINNFSFVLDGELAGCGVLGYFRDLGTDAQALQRAGIDTVVSLTEWALDASVLSSHGVPHYKHLPIPDFHAPTLDQVHEFVAYVDAHTTGAAESTRGEAEIEGEREGQEAKGAQVRGGVVVHCFGGSGRTGTMLAAYLVHRQNLQAEEAIQLVRKLRPRSIETKNQCAVIEEYAEWHHSNHT